jgi:hypothetical protein
MPAFMERYGVITQKNPREIVLLRGRGCVWGKCTFCDYHLDKSADVAANFALNASVLERVSGQFGRLEAINSGSVFELDLNTLERVLDVCMQKQIHTVHFETHWCFRHKIDELRAQFAPIELKMKLGLETFDAQFREDVLKKGIDETDPAKIARAFDEANLLVGLPGQTEASMRRDIELGLEHFERICVNVMCENGARLQPDKAAVLAFEQRILPDYTANERVDILVNNTDFGVGA